MLSDWNCEALVSKLYYIKNTKSFTYQSFYGRNILTLML